MSFIIGFLLGASILFNLIFIVIIYFLYNKLGKKVTADDVEEYLLNNFLEVETDV